MYFNFIICKAQLNNCIDWILWRYILLLLLLLLCKLGEFALFSSLAGSCFSLVPGNENDMLPVFTQLEYEFVIRADAKVGLAIGNVIAIDGDAGKP